MTARVLKWLRSWFRRPKPQPADYRIYTRDFDVETRGEDLDEILGRLSETDRLALEEAWKAFSGALQGWRTKAHIAALEASARIRDVVDSERLAGTTVTILIDQSGSMRGQSMLLAAASADIAGDFLLHLGISVEVLGFTTVGWRGGKSRERWLQNGRLPQPGRLCDLLHIVYRPADDRLTSTGGGHFKPMLRPDLPKENVDGEAVEWAATRLRARPENHKILLVVSDGAPVDDATLLANDLGILGRHLREVLGRLRIENDISIAAVGIGFDVRRFYPQSIALDTADDLNLAMISLLEKTIIDCQDTGVLGETV